MIVRDMVHVLHPIRVHVMPVGQAKIVQYKGPLPVMELADLTRLSVPDTEFVSDLTIVCAMRVGQESNVTFHLVLTAMVSTTVQDMGHASHKIPVHVTSAGWATIAVSVPGRIQTAMAFRMHATIARMMIIRTRRI